MSGFRLTVTLRGKHLFAHGSLQTIDTPIIYVSHQLSAPPPRGASKRTRLSLREHGLGFIVGVLYFMGLGNCMRTCNQHYRP